MTTRHHADVESVNYLWSFPDAHDEHGESIRTRALKEALDVRKFEIDLYWQRAKYFATLIRATPTGYGVVLSARHLPHQDTIAVLLSCIGLVLSFAWFRVNQGSKYWPENWERHVDSLENTLMGPLHKTTIARDRSSVSQINEAIRTYVAIVWIGLFVSSMVPKHLVPLRLVAALDGWFPERWSVAIVTAVCLIWISTAIRKRQSAVRVGQFERRI